MHRSGTASSQTEAWGDKLIKPVHPSSSQSICRHTSASCLLPRGTKHQCGEQPSRVDCAFPLIAHMFFLLMMMMLQGQEDFRMTEQTPAFSFVIDYGVALVHFSSLRAVFVSKKIKKKQTEKKSFCNSLCIGPASTVV